jgi:ribonucleotide monophosphatase NagD (HAD superfamily)
VKNRLNPYEAGWLTFLVSTGIATEADAREAMNRVAQAALDEINRLRPRKRAGKRRKRD